MVLVDTTVWVDYLNGVVTPETEWLDREASRQRLGLVDLTVCEVLQALGRLEQVGDAHAVRDAEGGQFNRHLVLHADLHDSPHRVTPA